MLVQLKMNPQGHDAPEDRHAKADVVHGEVQHNKKHGDYGLVSFPSNEVALG